MNRRQFIVSSALFGLSTPTLSLALNAYKTSSDSGERSINPLQNLPDSTSRGVELEPISTAPLEASGPIKLTATDSDIVISGKHFKDILADQAYAIHIQGNRSNRPVNIEIRDCLFENVRWAIRVDFSSNITINGNRFENCGQAIRVSSSSGIKIEHNEFKDLGQLEVLSHGYGGYWAQNLVQFIEVTGANNSVSWNIMDNSEADSIYLEDCISFWNSGGVESSWAMVEGNQFRGSTPGSSTGGAIVVGDAQGATTLYASYVKVKNNTIMRMQSVGIGVAGGHHYEVSGNRIYLPQDHTSQLTQHPYNREHTSTPGVGIAVFDYSRTLECHSTKIADNDVYSVRSDHEANAYWADYSTCSNITESGNDWHWDKSDTGNLGESMLPANMFAGLSSEYFSGRRGA